MIYDKMLKFKKNNTNSRYCCYFIWLIIDLCPKSSYSTFVMLRANILWLVLSFNWHFWFFRGGLQIRSQIHPKPKETNCVYVGHSISIFVHALFYKIKDQKGYVETHAQVFIQYYSQCADKKHLINSIYSKWNYSDSILVHTNGWSLRWNISFHIMVYWLHYYIKYLLTVVWYEIQNFRCIIIWFYYNLFWYNSECFTCIVNLCFLCICLHIVYNIERVA